ncbi:MAG: RpiB/LacA/LacB family sugar-phosphate isomerase [Alphaproteobacteria bacterium]
MKNKIYIASDHAGFEMKEEILKVHKDLLEDLGTNSKESVDYPDFASSLIENMKKDINSRGILICGTGNGMAIAANRHHNIRAGLVFNVEITKLIRQHNDANILVLPGRFIDVQEALKCIDIFLSTKFEEGRHKNRIKKISKD